MLRFRVLGLEFKLSGLGSGLGVKPGQGFRCLRFSFLYWFCQGVKGPYWVSDCVSSRATRARMFSSTIADNQACRGLKKPCLEC